MGLWQTVKEIYGLGTPAKEETENRAIAYSISDPELARWLGFNFDDPNLPVTEYTALGFSAWYRAVSLISGTIASLPLKTYRKNGEDREQVKSFLDNPGLTLLTPYAWKETLLVHMLNHGEVYLKHVYNNAGALAGLLPISRAQVQEVQWDGTNKIFQVADAQGQVKQFDSTNMTQIMGITFDGLRGVSPLNLFRKGIRLGLAGEKAAIKTMTNGAIISGLVTPDADMDETQAQGLKEQIASNMSGIEHAGDVVLVNQRLKFTPWSFNNKDTQFLELRQMQIEEVARFFGIPPYLLGSIEKQTSWGTGVAEQNLGLQKYTLQPWTSRIEEALSALLPAPRFAEFDYRGLLQGTPAEEITLLINQVNAGLLTTDEARQLLNRPPLPKSATPPNNSPQGAQSENKGGDSQDVPKN